MKRDVFDLPCSQRSPGSRTPWSSLRPFTTRNGGLENDVGENHLDRRDPDNDNRGGFGISGRLADEFGFVSHKKCKRRHRKKPMENRRILEGCTSCRGFRVPRELGGNRARQGSGIDGPAHVEQRRPVRKPAPTRERLRGRIDRVGPGPLGRHGARSPLRPNP